MVVAVNRAIIEEAREALNDKRQRQAQYDATRKKVGGRHRISDIPKPCAFCGENFYPRAYRWDASRFCKAACRNADTAKRNQEQRGDLNPNWRGGLTYDMTAYMKDQRELHAEKWDARRAVHEALARGILVKGPCADCGATVDIEADHHNGYAPEHWLDVVWLCTRHHGERRRGVPLPKKAETLARLGLAATAVALLALIEWALIGAFGGA